MVSWDETLEAAGAVVALTPAASSGPSAVSPLARTSEFRKTLGIQYCPVCKVDTMASWSGRCLWCDAQTIPDEERVAA